MLQPTFSLKSTVTALVLAAVASTSAFAAPSAKVSASVGDTAKVAAAPAGSDGWKPVLNASIKTANYKDLILGVSFETGLTTNTLVKSKSGTSDTSTATASVKVRVLVDRNGDGIFSPTEVVEPADYGALEVAAPGVVVYDKRSQTLMAKLGGIPNCTDTNGDNIYQISECTLTEEEIQLILETMAAHHFNFVIANLAPGNHAVQVQALLDMGSSFQAGSASADAWLGKGSLTIEEVRGLNGEGFSF